MRRTKHSDGRAGGRLRRLVPPMLALVPVLALPLGAGPATAEQATAGTGSSATRDGERLLFSFSDSRIDESSGLAVSPTHDDIVYTHNDSGDSARFFAVGTDGRTRATFRLAGVTARDWEAMAASVDPATGKGVLWFADIGDNLDGAWPDVSVYKVAEPETMRSATLQATRYRFRYEGGARNAEGLMVHPKTGRLYIVSKEFSGSVYAAPKSLRTDRVNLLRRVGPAPIMATDAAYAPDGSSFVIRTYFSASLYRAPGDLIAHLTMPPLKQAESITYTRDGKALLTGSEGVGSPVYLVPLPAGVTSASASASPTPAEAADAPAGTARPADTGSTAASGGRESGGIPLSMVALWLGTAVGAIGIITVIAYRTAR
ncbi:hypothetical protein IMZ11_17415 [Microtetraspora sp. AC03309]|uniref:hypothetical protein n=1 Tax=Microtetraspora sp. AC03309 TaxID=2779376 RepID=UPI001E522881|nr:hypothetical protein [Microtetraspora sp. AC03309]MCC5577406.1 hypothetical protein [Microtetraspora sp. AC03309]